MTKTISTSCRGCGGITVQQLSYEHELEKGPNGNGSPLTLTESCGKVAASLLYSATDGEQCNGGKEEQDTPGGRATKCGN